MILSNFFNIDGKDNEPGYNRYWFIHDSSVTYIPPVVDGVIDFEKITYAPGKDTWYVGGAIFESIELGEKEQKTANGSLYPINIAAKTAGIQPNVLTLFHRKRNGRFILIVADNNGNYFLCGEPNNGLIFNYSREAASFSFTYKGNYTIPCYFLANYLGSTPSPDPGGGVGGGLVTIKRVDGTIITTGTAPLEYTVANTNAVLKNSGGLTLSTTAIKPAGAPQEITAPDATINLRDSAGTLLDTVTAKSNETKNITAPNATITLKDTAGATLDTIAAKSGESKNVLAPDAVIILKDSGGAVLENTTAKSNGSKDIIAPDASIVLKDSDDNVLDLVPAKSGETKPLLAPDGEAQLINMASTPIGDIPMRAGETKIIVIPSTTIIIKDVYGNIIYTGDEPSCEEFNLTTNLEPMPTIVVITAVTHTLALTDAFNLLMLEGTAAQTITLPKDTTAAFPINTKIRFAGNSNFAKTFAPEAGATVVSVKGLLMDGFKGFVYAEKIAADTWFLSGDLIEPVTSITTTGTVTINTQLCNRLILDMEGKEWKKFKYVGDDTWLGLDVINRVEGAQFVLDIEKAANTNTSIRFVQYTELYSDTQIIDGGQLVVRGKTTGRTLAKIGCHITSYAGGTNAGLDNTITHLERTNINS